MSRRIIDINIQQGYKKTIVLALSQYDVGVVLQFNVYDGARAASFAEGTTVTLQGRRPSGVGFMLAGTIASNIATFTSTTDITGEAGAFPAELRFVSGDTDIGTVNLMVQIERAPHPDGTIDADITRQETFIERLEAVENDKVPYPVTDSYGTAGQVLSTLGNGATEWVDMTATGGGGTPIVARTAADMTDHDAIYVYVGSEPGYVNGHWYYYSEGAWVDSGQYAEGLPGADGYSPEVTVAQIPTGAVITVTDRDGTTTATVENGTATDAQVAAWLDDHPEATTTVEDGSVTPRKTNFWDISLLEGHYKAGGYTKGTLNYSTGVVTANELATTMVTDLCPLTADCFTTNFVVFSAVGTAAQGAVQDRRICLYKDGTFVKRIDMQDMWTDKATVGQSVKKNLPTEGTIDDFNEFRTQVNVGNELYYSGDTSITAATITNLATETYVMTNEAKTLFSEGLDINTPGSVTNEILADDAVTNDKIMDGTIQPRKLYPTAANNLLVYEDGREDYQLGGNGQDLSVENGWVSDYIPVSAGEQFTLNFVPPSFRAYATYDANKQNGVAYSVAASSDPYTITIPNNAHYIRVATNNRKKLYKYNSVFVWRLCAAADSADPTEYAFPWLTINGINKVLSSQFRDKIVLATGDSITENNERNNNKSWCEYLPEKLGLTVYNDGKSGTGLAKKYMGYHSILYRVENNWATDYAGITPDIVLIMGNMNDGTGTGEASSLNDLGLPGWVGGGVLAVGTPSDDITTQSVYGCAKRFLEDVITMYPLAKIGWILSTPRAASQPTYWPDKPNEYGHGWFEDYITAIRYQCEQYNVPVLDLYHESQFRPTNSTNMNAYMDDGSVHPNTAGLKKYMVDPIVKWIEQYFGEA